MKMMNNKSAESNLPPIKGAKLVALTIAVSCGIFMNVLDTSIANVAVPTIAGNLAVSPDQGTWVITSFTVTLAIVLPLTGWLAKRFGEVRLFLLSTALFTVASLLCGLSTNFPMLLFFRIVQGAMAGPMIPLSQSLLLANYPSDKKGLATALWATVAVAAPVLGPILGGILTDDYSWPWIFYINVPVGILSVYITWYILRDRETKTEKLPIDYMGIFLLAIGIGALQILLDQGKDLDWFESNVIIMLAIVSFISLCFLIVWELTDPHPIVDLSLFKSRNFTVGTLAISLGYGTYFGSVVILPLWLQTQYNYTATWAGLVTAPLGILPVILSPFMGKVMDYVDLRVIVSVGFIVFAATSFWLAFLNTDVSAGYIALARFVQGIGAPCFFIPTITILLSGLPNHRLASATGLSNFLRILAGSFGTSISVAVWDRREAAHQSVLVESATPTDQPFIEGLRQIQDLGFSEDQSYGVTMNAIINQAYVMSTNDIFWVSGFIFVSLLILVWFARPPFLKKSPKAAAE